MRNNVCLAYFMLNALWIAVILMIQVNSSKLEAIFPEYEVGDKTIKIEPLGM